MTSIAVLHQRTDDNNEVNIERIANLLYETIRKYEPKLLVGPEYLFYGNLHKPFTPEEKASLMKLLELLTKNTETILIPGSIISTSDEHFKSLYQNTTPIIYKGKTITEVTKLCLRDADKRFAYDNDCSAFNHGPQDLGDQIEEWIKAYTKDRTITIDNVKYLVEICDDHYKAQDYELDSHTNDKRLAELLGIEEEQLELDNTPPFEGPRSIAEVDFQIIVSNGFLHHFTIPREKLYLREGGILIECNGGAPSSFVGKAVGDKIFPVYISEKYPPEVKIIQL